MNWRRVALAWEGLRQQLVGLALLLRQPSLPFASLSVRHSFGASFPAFLIVLPPVLDVLPVLFFYIPPFFSALRALLCAFISTVSCCTSSFRCINCFSGTPQTCRNHFSYLSSASAWICSGLDGMLRSLHMAWIALLLNAA